MVALIGDGCTLHVNGEAIQLRDVQIAPPAIKARERDFLPSRIEASFTMTTNANRPGGRPWAEPSRRAMARVLNAPDLLPEGPERAAEIKRAKRRARNRAAVGAGGVEPLSTYERNRAEAAALGMTPTYDGMVIDRDRIHPETLAALRRLPPRPL